MELFLNKSEKRKRFLAVLLPALVPAIITICFLWVLSRAGEQTISTRQQILERALHQGAIRVYAMTGAYPQSLDELTSLCRISYDPQDFLVEYTPQGENLAPLIFVSPLKEGRGGDPS